MVSDGDDVVFADVEGGSCVFAEVDVLVADSVVWVGSTGDGGVV